MTKWVWFDMDGTIADLYGVEGWLNDLINSNTRPYAEAKDLYNQVDILDLLVELKARGYNLGVISWGSKNATKDYNKAVTEVKKAWLKERMFDILLDKIIVTPYGVKKSDTCKAYGNGILVDDEQKNRDEWELGGTVDATQNILTELLKIA